MVFCYILDRKNFIVNIGNWMVNIEYQLVSALLHFWFLMLILKTSRASPFIGEPCAGSVRKEVNICFKMRVRPVSPDVCLLGRKFHIYILGDGLSTDCVCN